MSKELSLSYQSTNVRKPEGLKRNFSIRPHYIHRRDGTYRAVTMVIADPTFDLKNVKYKIDVYHGEVYNDETRGYKITFNHKETANRFLKDVKAHLKKTCRSVV